MLRGKKKGFTLMEMMIVITILIILIALLVPKFMGYSDRAKDAVAETNAKAVVTAIGLYQTEEGTEKRTFQTGDLDKYLTDAQKSVKYHITINDRGIISGTVTTDAKVITLGGS